MGLLACSAGLLLSLDSQASDPLLLKSAWFAMGALLLAAMSGFKLWWGGGLRLPAGKSGLALLGLLAASLLSFLAAPARGLSEAALNAWLLWALLVVSALDWLAQDFAKRSRQVFLALAVLTSLISVVAGLEFAGYSVGGASVASRAVFGSRPQAFFGNPNFLAGFLVLAWPAGAYFLREGGKLRWLGLASSVLALSALALTQSKAAALGLVAQYACVGHLLFHHGLREQRTRWMQRWILAGLVLGLAALGAYGAAQKMGPKALTQKVLSLAQGQSDSVQFRLWVWKGSLQGFGQHVMAGQGPGSFAARFASHRPPELMASQVQRSYEVTHAENWLIQEAFERGLLGLAACAFFLWALFKPLWPSARDISKTAEGWRAGVILLGLLGPLFANLASLDLYLPSTFWFWGLLVALALGHSAKGYWRLAFEPSRLASVMASLALLLFIWMPSMQAHGRVRSSRHLFTAQEMSRAKQWEAALESYDKALLEDPFNIEALYFRAAARLDRKASGDLSLAEADLRRLSAMAPDYVQLHALNARLADAQGLHDLAISEWQRQAALDPLYLPAYNEIARLLAMRGEYKQAADWLEKGLRLDPSQAALIKNLEALKKR